MRATVWNDYVCPWSYLGRHRSAILVSMGVTIDRRPFELHPDLPAGGRPRRPDSRLTAVLDRVAAECDAAGLPFTVPSRTPNSRLALRTLCLVADTRPDLVEIVDDSISDARWVDGLDIADPLVLAGLLDRAGLDGPGVVGAAVGGAGDAAVTASIARARDAGVTSTPAWSFDTGFVIYGVHDPDTVRRWVERMQQRNT